MCLKKVSQKVLSVFKNSFHEVLFAILLLHGSHRSYPSRRRACSLICLPPLPLLHVMYRSVSCRFDLSETLTSGVPSVRDHIVYIHQEALQEDGIHALRHHQYKAHFTTEGNIFSSNEDLECSQKKQVISHCVLTVHYVLFCLVPPHSYSVQCGARS